MLRPRGPAGGADQGPGSPLFAGAPDVRLVRSLRALLSARGLAPEACTLTTKGVDPEGLIVLDVESEHRSLSLRLHPRAYEIVRVIEAGPPAP